MQSTDPSQTAPTESTPLLIDNRNGNTMAAAVRRCAEVLAGAGQIEELCLATGFFNLGGYAQIADVLRQVPRARLLLGAEPLPEDERPEPEPGQDEQAIEQEVRQRRLRNMERGLKRQRDLLPFDRETDEAVRDLLKLLHSGSVEVRRITGRPMHAKAVMFRTTGGGTLVGSSNLTYGGMVRNLELNLGCYDPPLVQRVEQWFDELWEQAEPFDLAAIYDRLTEEFPPYLMYLKVLWHLYGEELTAEQAETGLPLTTFQKHGVWRAMRIMKEYGGVLVADGVGLGKTFIAGEIVQRYHERRQRVLLICPASLRDSTWREFIHEHQLFLECVSYEELARDRQLGGDSRHLERPLEEYALVVIDEAHNYRNPSAPTRAGVLRRLLRGQKRDLLLLTATPVNNSLWDLYHLVRFFLKQDAALAARGVLSIRRLFQEAMRENPFDLNPDMLYPVIDATTVKRTRRFVKRHYPNDVIRLPDGTEAPIQFPKPVCRSILYDLEEVLPGFIDELEEALATEDRDGNPHEPLLKLARYQPQRYLIDPPPDEELAASTTMVGLLRSGLLKRFESSAYAFAETADRMIREHELFLAGLDRGSVLRKEALHEMSVADDEDAIEEIIATTPYSEPASLYRVKKLRSDVEADRNLLSRLRDRVRGIGPERDPKLRALIEELKQIVHQAEQEAVDEADLRRKRKVIVFSAYEDTITWIESFLDEELPRHPELKCYVNRRASVSGADSRGGVSRDEAIRGFAPSSAGRADHAADRFDLLLSTDVIAEGMNLQDCRNIINYDLPWNPMRLVQRHGRIDRISSPHKEVFLRTFFPDRQLDELLDLERRIRHKLAQAAASVGVEHAPIAHGPQADRSFAETAAEIEKLRQEKPDLFEEGGTRSAALSGEEYRQELRRALERYRGELEELPWKAGSGFSGGEQNGYVFCAQVGKRIYLRFVPVADGEIVREVGTCLRWIRCDEHTPRDLPDDMRLGAYDAWKRARQDIYDTWMRETDPANLQPRLRPLNHEVARFLREHPPCGLSPEEFEHILDCVESPWSLTEEREIREVFRAEYASDSERARALADKIRELGVEPAQVPEPLPPILLDDVRLICWMALRGGT